MTNEGLPAYMVSAMERRYGTLRGRTIGLLGMAFKAESDDVRSSLSYKLRKLLTWSGARVLCTDPYVVDARLVPLEQVIAEAEILVLGVPHRVYREAKLGDRELIDTGARWAGSVSRTACNGVHVKILVTGAAGFICGYLVPELLGEGNQIRHYTYGGDLAHGIRLAMESPKAINEDFNLSTPQSTTVLELAQAIWGKLNGDRPFRYATDAPFAHDVQIRVPDVRKAREVLGFEASTTLDAMLDEVIPWIRSEFEAGRI